MESKAVTIVLFATDEHDSLIQTVRGILSDCDNEDIDKVLIVYSSNATPACRSAVSLLEKEKPEIVESLEQTHPFLGGAVFDVKRVIRSSHVILFPSDLAISISSVAEMIHQEKENPEGIVKTSRWLNGNSFHDYSPVRKCLNRIGQSFLRLLFHSTLTDLTNPVQIMPSKVFIETCWKEKKHPILLELVLAPVIQGIQIKEIPTECHGRSEGKSKNTILQTFLYLRTAFRIRFFHKAYTNM